jgi:hypothetical protein
MPVEDEYASYDPREVRPDRTNDLPVPLVDDEGEALPTFDERYSEDFEGLLYLGALSKSFEWLGHRFVIRTLNQDELLTVPLLIKQWQGTIGQPKAYTSAMAGLCVVSVDGRDLPIPVGAGEGDLAWAYQRFDYAKANWYQFTIDKIYSEYLVLESRAQAVIEAMEKASGPAVSTGDSSATSAGPSAEDF